MKTFQNRLGSVAVAVLTTCQSLLAQPTPSKNTRMSTPASDKLVVYQIYTRLFGNQNTTNKFYGTRDENGTGKFNDITDKALGELKKFGISHVWYTGVIEHATMTDYSAYGIAKDNPYVVKGIAGSPYAIKDYYDVNPDLAVDVRKRMAEFEALVARSHKANLKVIIDCVPNHVARQYKSDVKPVGAKDFGEQLLLPAQSEVFGAGQRTYPTRNQYLSLRRKPRQGYGKRRFFGQTEHQRLV
jgi:Alpha amylase, catalytic domain